MSKKLFKVVGTIATVVAGAALIGTGIGSALGGTMMFTAFGASVAASTIATVAGVVSLGASMLSRPKAPATSNESTDRLSVSMDPRAPRKFVLGRTAMATDIRDQEFSNNQEYLHRFVVTASHKASAIEEIWFDDKKAWSSSGGVTSDFAGYLTVAPVLEGSAANAINLSARMGATRRYTGLSYVYFRFKLTGNSKKAESPFAQSIPTRVTIIGKGAPTYDPRLDSTVAGGSGAHRAADQTTWAWNDAASRNPALQLLWYLLGWRIKNPVTNEWRLAVGKGIPAARIDLASFITAANLCDEPVTLAAGGTQPRYRSDGVFSEADATGTVLDQLKAAMNAELDDVDGKIRITVLHNDLATPIADFNDDDILGGFTWDQTAPLDETYNVVRGTFIDPSTASLYQAVDFPEVRIDSLDGIDRIETVDFQTVQDASQAQRLVKQRIARMLYSGRFTATFSYRAWKVQKNDVIRLTFGALGWTNKLFRVIETAVQVDGQVPMVLQVENADIYLWDRDERPAIQPVQPTSYDPYLNPIYQDVVEPKYADGTTIDELRPAEPGATDGANQEEKDLLAELDADVAQAEIDIAAAQATIAGLQSDAAATQAALTQAQADIQAQGDEILAAQGDIIANASAISTVSNTVSAQGSSITTLQQTVSGQAGSISTLQQTVATQGGSITTLQQNVTTLEGSVSTLQQTVSTQGSSISQNATAITTLQGNLATLTNAVRAGSNPNLVKNGGFETGTLQNWTAAGATFAAGISGGWGMDAHCYSNIPDNSYLFLDSDPIPVFSNTWYTAAADSVLQVTGGSAWSNVQIMFFDAGGTLRGNPQGAQRSSNHDYTADGSSRAALKVSGTSPTDAVSMRVRLATFKISGTLTVSGFRQIKAEQGQVATPFSAEASVVQTYVALSTLNGQYASLSSTVSAQGSSISQNATAIAGLGTRTASLESTVSAHAASISQNATAISGLQGNVATLTTRVSASGANLLTNGGLENQFATGIAAPDGFAWSNSTSWGPVATTFENRTHKFYFTPLEYPQANAIYTLSADPLAFGSSDVFCLIECVDANGSVTASSPLNWAGAGDFSNDDTRRGRMASSITVPSGTRFLYPIVIGTVRDGQPIGFRRAKLQVGSQWSSYSAEASITQSFQALSTLTTQYASLSTTVTTQGVTITSQQTAITTINNNLTTVMGQYVLNVDANGRTAGMKLLSNGTTSVIRFLADYLTIESQGGGASFEYANGNIRLRNAAGVVKVRIGIG